MSRTAACESRRRFGLSRPGLDQAWRVFASIQLAAWCCWHGPAPVHAQSAPLHYFQSAMHPPGVVGQGQLLRDPRLPGQMQPVELQTPEGAKVSVQSGGEYGEPQPGPVLAGMLVGGVYSIKITSIPNFPGSEVYPSVEVINRLYPPQGQSLRFPIPIQFTQEELELALAGKYVTRVVYLEDPENALPIATTRTSQRYYDVAPQEDPLLAADRLGRPMLIMRMGSRVPSASTSLHSFGDPPVTIYPRPAVHQAGNPAAAPGLSGDQVEQAIERPGYNIPRLPPPPNPWDWMRPQGYLTPR